MILFVKGEPLGGKGVNWAYCICPSLFHNSFPTPSTLLGWKPKNLPRHCRQTGSPKLHADMQSLINIIYVASFCRQCCVMSQNFVLSVYQPFQTSQNHPFCYFTLSNVRWFYSSRESQVKSSQKHLFKHDKDIYIYMYTAVQYWCGRVFMVILWECRYKNVLVIYKLFIIILFMQ